MNTRTPEINRRRLLLGLAAASTAAATVTVATAATINENPELLRLGGLLPALEADYRAATTARSAIVKKWSKHWPSAPVELHERGCSEIERDLTGRAIVDIGDRGAERPRPILTTGDLEWSTKHARRILKNRGVDKRNKMGMNRAEWEEHLDELVETHRIAAAYEAEKARTLKASGYKAADERMHTARKALCSLVGAIMSQPETSIAGVMVKAQAMVAWGAVPPLWSMLESHEWGTALAASIVRVAGEAVAS